MKHHFILKLNIELRKRKEGRETLSFYQFPPALKAAAQQRRRRKESRFGAGIVKLNCAKMERFFAELTFTVQLQREREREQEGGGCNQLKRFPCTYRAVAVPLSHFIHNLAILLTKGGDIS